MIDFALQFLVLLGVAMWLPAPVATGHWIGARFALAGLMLPIYLFAGNVTLAIPISAIAWGALGLGTLGFVAGLARSKLRGALHDFFHPVYVLTALLAVALVVRGELSYQPYLGDEFASWLNHAKQMYLADSYTSALMDYHLPSYSNGWPLLISAFSSFHHRYTEAPSVTMVFLLHLGVVAFAYDLIEHWATETRSKLDPRLIGWAAIVVWLAAEITWRLLPTDLLIEPPLLYCYTFCFLTALTTPGGDNAWRLSVYWGIAICAGYLFKVSMLAIAPALGIVLLAQIWRGSLTPGWISRLIVNGTILVGPVATAITIWAIASPGGQVEASLGGIDRSNVGELFSVDGFAIMRWMVASLLDYSASYKLPLTLVTGAALLASLSSRRWASIVVGFAVFAVTTWIGLYLYYLFREQALVRGYLESFPRFVNLPLRIFHMLGFLALVYTSLRYIVPRLNTIAKPQIVDTGLILTIIVGLSWQAGQVVRAIDDITDRRYQSVENIRSLERFRTDLTKLTTEVSARIQGVNPKLGVIDRQGYGVAQSSALYYSLKTDRALAKDSYRYFIPRQLSSLDGLDHYDVVWPVSFSTTDAARIAEYLVDRDCARHLLDVFLFRTDEGRFICVAKDKST